MLVLMFSVGKFKIKKQGRIKCHKQFKKEVKMNWQEVRKAYPDQWLIIEALQARTSPDNHRLLDKIAVIERCDDGISTYQTYHNLHKKYRLPT